MKTRHEAHEAWSTWGTLRSKIWHGRVRWTRRVVIENQVRGTSRSKIKTGDYDRNLSLCKNGISRSDRNVKYIFFLAAIAVILIHTVHTDLKTACTVEMSWRKQKTSLVAPSSGPGERTSNTVLKTASVESEQSGYEHNNKFQKAFVTWSMKKKYKRRSDCVRYNGRVKIGYLI